MRLSAMALLLAGCYATQGGGYYKTDYRLVVSQADDRPRVSKADLDMWTLDALAFWRRSKPEWECCIDSWTRLDLKADVLFDDNCDLTCPCGLGGEMLDVYGYHRLYFNDQGKTAHAIVVGHCGKDRAIFMHEMGHLIASVCGGSSDPEHILFEKEGYDLWIEVSK